jgi:hypothetical protein
MSDSLEPEFPTLLVHEDGTLTVVYTGAEWRRDPDLWYQSEPVEYLVDQRGYRFDQRARRGDDQRPIEPPEWRATRQCTSAELVEMVRTHLAREGHDQQQFSSALSRVSEAEVAPWTIDYVRSLENVSPVHKPSSGSNWRAITFLLVAGIVILALAFIGLVSVMRWLFSP